VRQPVTDATTAERIVIQRALNPGSGASLGTIDLAGASSSSLEVQPLTITGSLAGDALWASSRFFTAGGAAIGLQRTLVTTPAAAQYLLVPAAQRIAGDVHEVAATAIGNEPEGTMSRMVSVRRSDTASETLVLGPIPSTVAPDVYDNNINRTRPQVRVQSQPEYELLHVAIFSQRIGTSYREVTVIGTSSVAGTGSVRLRAPGPTGSAGWNEVWELRDRVNIDWSHTAYGWDGSPALVVPTSVGTVVRSATRTGVLIRAQ
jgi:hypothetical protein